MGGEKVDIIKAENLNFSYPESSVPALTNITFTIKKGEFITLCGKSGCGKTTLLRLLKPTLSPHGKKEGVIIFSGEEIHNLTLRSQTEKIGFVLQSPDNQIVCDKVWHELAFGLENLGIPANEIRTRVAEISSFFGIEDLFEKKVSVLSGGQKQLLNLAAVMVMQPEVLILDEPTSQLDPIAAHEFIQTLSKINSELGTTVILSEHRLEEAFPVSDKIMVMDEGKIIAFSTPDKIGHLLKNNDMFPALPASVRIFTELEKNETSPFTVKDARSHLIKLLKSRPQVNTIDFHNENQLNRKVLIDIHDVWFRYEKNQPDIIKGLNLKVYEREFYAIVGGNGTGKTTTISLLNGSLKPYRGNISINKNNVFDISNRYTDCFGILPQNPTTLFVKKTVGLDLYDMLSDKKLSEEEKRERISFVTDICELNNLLNRHPYDLSGGEQQRAALAKILLLRPKILLLDEPTKGLDAHFKIKLAKILTKLKNLGMTIVMVSHDIEFCAQYAERCGMFFNGSLVSEGYPKEFFLEKSFYTTAASRISRGIIKNAVLTEDVLYALGAKYKIKDEKIMNEEKLREYLTCETDEIKSETVVKRKIHEYIIGIIFIVLFVLNHLIFKDKYTDNRDILVQLSSILFAFGSLYFLIPKKLANKNLPKFKITKSVKKTDKTNIISFIIILMLIPITIFSGIYIFDDRKYYFISLLIILEILIPFIMTFEGRRPDSRSIVIISVLCAIAVSGRSAFFMLPQFKPIAAVIIISSVCLGGKTGFLIGAISGFISNFFFTQGPWTPWQMISLGFVGLITAGIFRLRVIPKTKLSLSIIGSASVLLLYGPVMNISSVLMWQPYPTFEMLISSCVLGFPFDLIHAASTFLFLWFAAPSVIEKIERIKTKYGIK